MRETELTHTVNNVNRQKATRRGGCAIAMHRRLASKNPEPFFGIYPSVNSRSLPKQRLSSCRSVIRLYRIDETSNAQHSPPPAAVVAGRQGSQGAGAAQSVTVAVFEEARQQYYSSSTSTSSKQIESILESWPDPARQLASARVKVRRAGLISVGSSPAANQIRQPRQDVETCCSDPGMGWRRPGCPISQAKSRGWGPQSEKQTHTHTRREERPLVRVQVCK